MAGKILIVTPHSSLGGLIRRSLEQGGQRPVSLAATSLEAVSLNLSTPHDLAILDGDLTPSGLGDLARQLRRQQPAIRILALPPSGSPNRPPFDPGTGSTHEPSFDELVRYVDRLFPAAEPEPLSPHLPSETVPPTPASQIVSQIASQMAPLLASTNAQAALFYIQGQVVSYPEQLPGEAFESITRVLSQYLTRNECGDLAHYLTWASNPAPFLLYAARLPAGNSQNERAAALLFASQTPLSRARAQVHAFTVSLEACQAGLEGIQQTPNETPMLEDQPLPDPGLEEASPTGIEAAYETTSAWVREVDGSPIGDTRLPDDGAPPDSSPTIPGLMASENISGEERSAQAALDSQPVDTVVAQDVRELTWSLPEPAPPSEEGLLPALVPPGFIIETQPRHTDPLEPVTTNVYNLAYTGLFIPRLPQHFLTRELADLVGSTFPHLCLAYGWRLEALSVRPEYIQWIVRAAPSIAPNTLLKVLRQRSSQVIFDTYPLLRQDNPSGDFWAPGYLILGGVHAPSTALVREFILQTRRRQGIQAD